MQSHCSVSGSDALCTAVVYLKLHSPIKGVVVCTDLSGKEPHRLLGMGRVVTSGILCGVMLSTLAWNARCQFDFCSWSDISHFHHRPPMTLVDVTMILYMLHPVWLLNLPCVYMYMHMHCLRLSNCKHYMAI